ncbi:MAG: hypothetical protein AAB656_00760 [Patescibacteria group bacterium]
MRVAVLYLLTGVGHFREATAIRDELVVNGHEVDMIDPFEKFSNSDRLATRIMISLYKGIVKVGTTFIVVFPKLGEKGLTFTDSSELRLFKSLIRIGERLEWLVGRYFGSNLGLSQYKYFVSTHPMATRMVVGFARSRALKMSRIINVCPDEVGGFAGSFYKVDGVINTVNSKKTGKIFEKLGLKKKYIRVVGHPLDPVILKNRRNIYDRVQYDLNDGRLILGLYLGYFAPESEKAGILSVIKEVSPLLRAKKIKAKVLTGGHKDFENRLRLTIKSLKIENLIEVIYTQTPLDIVRKGHSWMLKDINIMFSRPSELVFYSLATGIPHVTFPLLGPQEEDMLSLLRNNSPVEDWKSLRGRLESFLFDKVKLINISKRLFDSGYNLNGAVELPSLLRKV